MPSRSEVPLRLLTTPMIVAVLACGGGGNPISGSATFSGTINGQSMAPKDATAANVPFNPTGRGGSAAVIAITTAAGICPALTSGKEPKNTQYLVLTAFRLQPDGSAAPPSAPGLYPVGALTIENAVALFAATDASCHNVATSNAVATSGDVTLSSVGSRYSGSYDLTFAFGDHVTGTFDAPVCAGLSDFAEGKGTLACQ